MLTTLLLAAAIPSSVIAFGALMWRLNSGRVDSVQRAAAAHTRLVRRRNDFDQHGRPY